MIVTLGILDFVPGFSLSLLIFLALFTLLIIPKAFIDFDFRFIQQSLSKQKLLYGYHKLGLDVVDVTVLL